MDLNVARFNLAAESGEQVDVKDVVSPTKVRPRRTKRGWAAGAVPPRLGSN